MALREIVTEGYESLSKICKPVTSFDSRLELLVKDMKDTLVKADGLGLAAPQIGVLKRLAIIIDGETDEMVALINPEITAMSGVQNKTEGCLSVPGKQGLVKRPAYVRLEALDRNGELKTYEGTELLARCFCHELDHLDGILYVDKTKKFLYPDEEDGEYYLDEEDDI